MIAMKFVRLDESDQKLMHSEIKIHKKVYHPFIVQYLGEVIEKNSMCFFMEGMEHVSIN